MKTFPSKNNIGPLSIITMLVLILAIISYVYLSITSNQIIEIAAQDVRSNAKIGIHDLSKILVRTIETITNSLEILRTSPSIQSSNLNQTQVLLNNVQISTSELTEGYYWINDEGLLMTWSNRDISYVNKINVSQNEYYTIPRQKLQPFFSSIIESADEVPRLFISYPIINNNIFNRSDNRFAGVIVAVINVKTLGKFLQNELPPDLISTIGLMDKKGDILYSRNPNIIGKSFNSSDFQDLIPIEIKNTYNKILGDSLTGISGSQDLTINGTTTTISYRPVLFNNEYLWTIYTNSPHLLASNVGLLINQQKIFTILIVSIIGIIAIIIAYVILSWNKRLENAVNLRTAELEEKNNDLEKTNRLLAEANKQLKIHDNMQKEFINIAAHELRTPIMPILCEAEIIEDKYKKSKRIVIDIEQIQLIARNARRLDRLATDILDVSKIESKSLRLNKEHFNLSEIITDIVNDTKEHIKFDKEYEKINIIKDVTPVTIYADKARIIQVITNLINNALKFTTEGNIYIKSERNGDNVYVSISDTGKGIDQEIIPRLFSKFVTKSDRGTGLGLYISKNIISAHGGKIWGKNNAEDKGAIFTFTLPLNNNL